MVQVSASFLAFSYIISSLRGVQVTVRPALSVKQPGCDDVFIYNFLLINFKIRKQNDNNRPHQWWTSVEAKPESVTDSRDCFLSSVTQVFVFDRHRIYLVMC